MNAVTSQIKELLAPTAPKEMDFEAATAVTTTQRIARIVKTVFFSLASLVLTVAAVVFELIPIVWPITLTIVATVLIAGAIFYRLHSLDKQYVEGLTDEKRSALVTQQIETIFHDKNRLSDEEIAKTLKRINGILGIPVFTKIIIANTLRANALTSDVKHQEHSIVEIALERHLPTLSSRSLEWTKEGRFGHPKCTYKIDIDWSDIPGKTQVIYSRAEIIPPK